EQLELLLRAARACRGGEPTRALDLLDVVAAFEDDRLECWRQALRTEAVRTRGIEAEQALLDELRDWASHSRLRSAQYNGWLGNLRYRQSRFADAARLHALAAATKDTLLGRLASLANEACAWLEALRFATALDRAREVIALGRIARHALLEGIAVWVERAALYRDGAPGPARPDLVTAAEAVAPWLAANLALVEGARAWRQGDIAQARALVATAIAGYRQTGLTEPMVLAACFEAHLEGPAHATRRAPLAREAMACTIPDLALQGLGLLMRDAQNPEWHAQIERLAASRPRVEWAVRLDIISVAEALGAADWG
ncbi:MAG: hypothetical protein KC620_12805, partial [Myxococcales bacterium]|nr:hypothetical protein [Myxococcales bacterium]